MKNRNIKILCDIDGVILPLKYTKSLVKYNTHNTYLYYDPIIVPFINTLYNQYDLSWLSYREDESIIVNEIFNQDIKCANILTDKINTVKHYSNYYQHIIWIDDEDTKNININNIPSNVHCYCTNGDFGIIKQDISRINNIFDNIR